MFVSPEGLDHQEGRLALLRGAGRRVFDLRRLAPAAISAAAAGGDSSTAGGVLQPRVATVKSSGGLFFALFLLALALALSCACITSSPLSLSSMGSGTWRGYSHGARALLSSSLSQIGDSADA